MDLVVRFCPLENTTFKYDMGTIFELIELGAYQLERYPGPHFTFIDPRIAKDEDAIVQKVRRLLVSHYCPNRVDGRCCNLHFCYHYVPGSDRSRV